MANLLHTKGTRTQIYKTLPSNSVGNDGDIILSQIQGKGVYLCSKVNGRWHVSNKMEELRKIEKTSIKDLKLDRVRVGNTTITKDEYDVSYGDFTLDVAGNIVLEANTSINSDAPLKIKEAAAAVADTTAYGQLWVKTATPNELYFTTDAGNDIQITSGTSLVGDITGVTITTDSGGGSAASDTSGSADFSILGSNGVGVTNSGTTITAQAVPGEIDHDSLNNFVANEHIDWTGSSAGTIHSSNYSNTMGSGFTVSATTDSNATTITQGDDLMFTAGTGITCETTADGTVTISSTVTDTNTTYSAGALLDLSTTTFNVDLTELTDGTADVVGSADELVYLDDGVQKRKQINEIKLGQFNNDQGWTSNTGDITGVDLTGGTGISIDSETNTTSGAYSSTITCNLEGTELVSTGETGGTKFLREDGDGTCSWQTVSGGGGISWDGSTANGVATYKDADEATVESNLTFDGTDLSIASTGKVILGAGDSYILESSADVLDLYAGGDLMLRLTENASTGNKIDCTTNPVGFTQFEPTYNVTHTIVSFNAYGNKAFVTFGSGNITNMKLYFPSMSGNFVLLVKQDGSGSRTVTNWLAYDSGASAAAGSSTVKFAGGSNPTLTTAANHVDIISIYWDADNEIAYGVASLDFQD
tara:strand:- start:1776 stop:3716 length:1941 start_codon:yes stop_codon:yes gene_type:complete